jgi:hypothetical protein
MDIQKILVTRIFGRYVEDALGNRATSLGSSWKKKTHDNLCNLDSNIYTIPPLLV